MIITLFVLLTGISFGATDKCEAWFRDLKITSNCLLKCSSGLVDLSTFACHDRCSEFCRSNSFEVLLSYYKITEKEIEFCRQSQSKCMKAYLQSYISERLCSRLYESGLQNDESDACRHFVWAVKLYKEIGIKDAETVLNAHEDNPKNPEEEKAMDLANNRAGLLAAEKMKEFKDEKILEAFTNHLREKKLIVLEPRSKKK